MLSEGRGVLHGDHGVSTRDSFSGKARGSTGRAGPWEEKLRLDSMHSQGVGIQVHVRDTPGRAFVRLDSPETF